MSDYEIEFVEKPKYQPWGVRVRQWFADLSGREWSQLLVVMLVSGTQWHVFVMICRTEGQHGMGSFLMIIALIALVRAEKSRISRVVDYLFIASAIAMSLYYSFFGW